ncbi:hypothetical protein BU14_0082s0030 [Porphyra umbilicalis]|uniref:Uncharacterized protein n=1 Tax=Porphyra umbilicalis TaxID=2786 RepID=A0A1X6PET5_PORUM|nr:hypothetical protein BU14_0082s0030 [Porphyra umbilicalis]|eukprot:OSX79265.1 hypothetical protein BU14_0082s0030 [Porphyra umbilicalis]
MGAASRPTSGGGRGIPTVCHAVPASVRAPRPVSMDGANGAAAGPSSLPPSQVPPPPHPRIAPRVQPPTPRPAAAATEATTLPTTSRDAAGRRSNPQGRASTTPPPTTAALWAITRWARGCGRRGHRHQPLLPRRRRPRHSRPRVHAQGTFPLPPPATRRKRSYGERHTGAASQPRCRRRPPILGAGAAAAKAHGGRAAFARLERVRRKQPPRPPPPTLPGAAAATICSHTPTRALSTPLPPRSVPAMPPPQPPTAPCRLCTRPTLTTATVGSPQSVVAAFLAQKRQRPSWSRLRKSQRQSRR